MLKKSANSARTQTTTENRVPKVCQNSARSLPEPHEYCRRGYMDVLTRFKSKRGTLQPLSEPKGDADFLAAERAPEQQEAPVQVVEERAEEVAVSIIKVAEVGFGAEVPLMGEPSFSSEIPASPMETTSGGDNGRGTLSASVIAAAVQFEKKQDLALLKAFDKEWEKLSPEVATLCEELLTEGRPGAADQIGFAARMGVRYEVCKKAAELWRTNDTKKWTRARDMLYLGAWRQEISDEWLTDQKEGANDEQN